MHFNLAATDLTTSHRHGIMESLVSFGQTASLHLLIMLGRNRPLVVDIFLANWSRRRLQVGPCTYTAHF